MKRTETSNFAKEFRGFSNEDQEKEVESDEVHFKGIPSNYRYKDIKKDLFA